MAKEVERKYLGVARGELRPLLPVHGRCLQRLFLVLFDVLGYKVAE